MTKGRCTKFSTLIYLLMKHKKGLNIGINSVKKTIWLVDGNTDDVKVEK